MEEIKMVDLLLTIADLFISKILKSLLKIIGDINSKIKNKRIFQNWIDFYKGKNRE